jgi:hypothetical protein
VIVGLVLVAVGVFHVRARKALAETYTNSFMRWNGLNSPIVVAVAGCVYTVVGLAILFAASR